MPHATAKTLLFWIAMTAPALTAAQAPAAPSFQDLEASYPHATRSNALGTGAETGKAQALLSASLPAGTLLTVAEARLQSAGATCRAERHAPGTVKCLYHQYDLSDGAADDIRWTIALHGASDQLADFSVDRYVDRHGTN